MDIDEFGMKLKYDLFVKDDRVFKLLGINNEEILDLLGMEKRELSGDVLSIRPVTRYDGSVPDEPIDMEVEVHWDILGKEPNKDDFYAIGGYMTGILSHVYVPSKPYERETFDRVEFEKSISFDYTDTDGNSYVVNVKIDTYFFDYASDFKTVKFELYTEIDLKEKEDES